MKKFTEYLAESTKQWDFRIKVAGEFTTEQAKTMEALLVKYHVTSFKKIGVTPIQLLPLDFPKIRNSEVTIYEASVNYPTTQFELRDYLCDSLNISKDAMVVRKPGEDLELYQETSEEREGALLDDPDYKESPNHKFEDYYGDKYNASFLKELQKDLDVQRTARGEKIPTESKVTYNTDDTTNNRSPINQSAVKKKK